VEFLDTTDGSTKSNLTISGQTVFTIAGANTTATTTTTTDAATAITTESTGLSLYLWTQDVIDEMYGNTATRADNKQLLASIYLYGSDYNGNSVLLNAAVTLTP
jgi:hypothetical protein